MIITIVTPHIVALPRFTAAARHRRPPLRSRSHKAMVRFAPNQVHQVHSECWLESPLTHSVHIVGR
jgi:hypothetical protein